MTTAKDSRGAPGTARTSLPQTVVVHGSWHRDVDDVLLGTRPGAVASPTTGSTTPTGVTR